MSTLNVKPYDASLQKLASSFCSGNTYLDQFLRGSHSLDPNYGKTYVLLSDNGELIIGYYNLGMGYIEESADGKRFKLGGAVHINGFAVDARFQDLLQAVLPDGSRMYLADFLLLDCIERIGEIRDNYIGCSFITLCATEEGYHLYKRHGFEPVDEEMWFSTEDEGTPYASMYYAIDLE
jgi:ribosomal protein S18 acetylase RimI-like enzyme